jgi:hypothetical protein
MAGQHNLDSHFCGALHDRVEVIHLEPEQHTIAVRSVGSIANRAVMVLDFKAVQLQHEPAILHQLLILFATVGSAATQQALIPAAAGFDIRDTNERLGAHGSHTTRTRLGEQIIRLQRARRAPRETLIENEKGRDDAATLPDLSVRIRVDPVVSVGRLHGRHDRHHVRRVRCARVRDCVRLRRVLPVRHGLHRDPRHADVPRQTVLLPDSDFLD